MYSEDKAEVCRDDEKRCSSSTEGKERVDLPQTCQDCFCMDWQLWAQAKLNSNHYSD